MCHSTSLSRGPAIGATEIYAKCFTVEEALGPEHGVFLRQHHHNDVWSLHLKYPQSLQCELCGIWAERFPALLPVNRLLAKLMKHCKARKEAQQQIRDATLPGVRL